jgi:hypothetical protein
MDSVVMVRRQKLAENVVEVLLLGLCLLASVYGIVQLGGSMPLSV